MKILISGSFWHGSIEESYARAFEAIGWTVERSDWEKRASANRLGRNAFTEKLFRNQIASLVGSHLVEDIKRVQPDIVFVVKGRNIGTRTLERIKQLLRDRPLINFNPDSPWDGANRSKRFLEGIPSYDVHYIWNRQLKGQFIASGAQRVEYLPFAHDPILHHPISLDTCATGPDAVFVGTYSEERDKLLATLHGLDIRIVGNGWSHAKQVPKQWITSTALYGEEALKVLAAGACAVNILRPQNEGSHNMRTFEIPASARPMLTTRSTEQSEWFAEGREMECFSSPEELSRKIKLLRNDREYAEEVARNGYERVRKETYEKRARQIIESLGFGEGGKG